jgi:diacylglycerol kinase
LESEQLLFQVKMISRRKFHISLLHAISGLKYLLRTQNNIRIHIIATSLAIAVGILLKITTIEWAIILIVISLVWVVEAINTVFERLFDLFDENYNPIVKIGKDVSATSVLMCALLSVIVGLIIFVPHLITLVRSFYK